MAITGLHMTNKKTYEQIAHVITATVNALKQERAFLDQLPSHLKTYQVDNPQICAYYELTTTLLRELCNEYEGLYEDIDWFLYEWPNLKRTKEIPYIEIAFNIESKKYFIRTIEDYLKYIKEVYF